MYVVITHAISDPAGFQTQGQKLGEGLPEGVQPLQFLPDPTGTKAACLWQGPSVESVQAHVDGVLGSTSRQDYFAVAEEYATGLPVTA